MVVPTRPTRTSLTIAGPCDPHIGFVRDFLEEVNDHESYQLVAGDVVRPKYIACDGYTVDDITLLPRRRGDPRPLEDDFRTSGVDAGDDDDDSADEDGNAPKWRNVGRANIVLRPTERTPRVRGNEFRFVVTGLDDSRGNETISFTLLQDDPLANSIAYDSETGVITLDARVIEYDSYVAHPTNEILFHVRFHDCQFQSSPFLRDVWERYENAIVSEGVLYSDVAVPGHLRSLLDKQISELASNEAVDWHPGSHDRVRDLVHPSLYPYIDGESPVSEAAHAVLQRIRDFDEEMTEGRHVDRWGRHYECSRYQWLPTLFRIKGDGSVTIEGYINNLDRAKYAGLYESVARLFEAFLPRFEQVYAYLKELRILPEEEEDLLDIPRRFNPDFEGSKLRNMQLRVITKIVDYELWNENEFVEGVFHVEGMSSDHILMTGIYVVNRDEDFEGAEMVFERTFLDFEGSAIYGGIAQCRHWMAERIVDECRRPLGRLETPKGRLIVFPNSHIHRLSRMHRRRADADDGVAAAATASPAGTASPSGTGLQVCRRRVVVFWVVDPERDVITTQEVARQQGVIPLERARLHRLALMEERRRHKDTLYGERKISLCEH